MTRSFALVLDAKMIYANPKVMNLGLRANLLFQIQLALGVPFSFQGMTGASPPMKERGLFDYDKMVKLIRNSSRPERPGRSIPQQGVRE